MYIIAILYHCTVKVIVDPAVKITVGDAVNVIVEIGVIFKLSWQL